HVPQMVWVVIVAVGALTVGYSCLLRAEGLLIHLAMVGGLAAIRVDENRHSFLYRLGAVPALRYLLVAAFGFSMVFFLASLHHEINPENLAKDIYTSSGWELALVMIFLLSAAGIGATFSALFEVYQSVSAGNYDPKLDSMYWVRIGIGLMAGLMLAQVLPLPPRDPAADTLTRPLLALLGGYSASVVHRILDRLVAAVDSIFMPKQGSDPAAAERDLQQRVTEEQSRQLKMFDQLLGQVSAAGGGLGDVRSKLLTLLPGGLSPGLAGKAERLALSAGIGLVTGGIKAASEKVVEGSVGNAGDLAAATVKEVLPSSGGVAGGVAGLAGPVATLIAGEAKPGAGQENENSAAAAVARALPS
ncbi:MAG TPA: hypothetical protein VE690_09555, partial [Rhodopila sp.]|nr:hypothetical protein [Rhodopila sp.]